MFWFCALIVVDYIIYLRWWFSLLVCLLYVSNCFGVDCLCAGVLCVSYCLVCCVKAWVVD